MAQPDPLSLQGGDPAAKRCMEASAEENSPNKKQKLASVPVIDLSPFLQEPSTDADCDKVAAAVAEACEEVGFFVAVGHGIDPSLMKDCAIAGKAFFALPEEKKALCAANGRAYGFFPADSEALGYDANVEKRPDLREAFSMGPQEPLPPPGSPEAPDPSEVVDFCYQETPWPQDEKFREVMVRYYEELGNLADGILKIFARALKVDADFFLSKTRHHASSLRVIHYPKLMAEPLPGQMRCGAHSDIATITILWQDVHGGLEVLPRSCKSWMEVRCPEDGLIVNLGDLFMRWTNDRWLSTPHRVLPPPLHDGRLNVPRISMPYFQILNSDADVSCIKSCLIDGEKPKYDAITQGRDLMAHFKRWGRNRSD
mmetsp:Transcript_62161/g.117860  ORF Transcript_62161/g.117860 Transcript_62161/m.117860 type:complete len:370 (-) Transcript_62161:83-1192(-)